MKIGVMLPNWVGDAAMATPALRAIDERFGGSACIVGVMRPYVADVFSGTPWIDQVVFFDPRSRDPELTTWSVVRRLRRMQLDHFVLLTNSLRAGVIARLSGARRQFGYDRNGRGWLLTDALRPPRNGRRWKPISAVDYYLELVSLLGCSVASRELALATTGEHERQAARAWRRLGWAEDVPVVGLCPGGAYGAAKHWPAESFAEFGRRVVERFDCRALIVAGPAERDFTLHVEQLADHASVVALTDEEPSIALTKACLRRCRLAVTTDSGPRHLAAGLGIPTVALFGPTDPAWSLNYNPHERRLQQTDLDCLPCAQRRCPLGHHRCMRELTVDRVLAAAAELWNVPVRAAA